MKDRRDCRLTLGEVTPKRYDLDVIVKRTRRPGTEELFITLEGQGFQYNTGNASMTLKEIVSKVLRDQLSFAQSKKYLMHISTNPADNETIETDREGITVEDHGIVFYA